MAFTKEQKQEMVSKYEDWLKKSQAVFMVEYTKMDVNTVGELRGQIREAGGLLHVTKNTLFKIAMEQAEYAETEMQEGTTICGFAFEDAPAIAKLLTEAAKDGEKFTIKGGFLNGAPLSADQIVALSKVPPLPVMRATLLSTILAPATQLVRVLAEPGRQVAAVIKAFSEKEADTAAA
ncbi:MAG: 50S ribosomal protein L10 [Anaerolineaceae bacterium]|nr:50S ribosomal protein L10 [Anaerolineaceae bacterium]